ncbi:hypothetical protein ACPPVU_00065 [Mucilaginibacter sp. McL0603]|uniref:hypothetical protein n=1 Tax=Mucilaginibacter sp. McL0603 TaxID=3415670 RepID=UPI003CFB07FA
MKKLLFLAAGVLFVLYSCKKSTPAVTPLTNGISATINGVNETFNFAAFAESTQDGLGSGYEIIFLAAKDPSNSSGIKVIVNFPNQPTIGTYSFDPTNVNNLGPEINYFNSDGPDNRLNAYGTSDGPYTGTVTITSLSSTNVQGTFSGTLHEQDQSSAVHTVTITNGKFNVKFQ